MIGNRRFRLVPTMAFVMVWVLVAATGLSTVAAKAQSVAGPTYHLVNEGYLTVATYGTDIPGVVIEPGGTLGGADGKFVNSFVKDHHLKLKLFQTTFASTILAVQDHKADMGMDIFFTPIRAKQMYYASPYLGVGTTAIFTQKSFDYKGPSSMAGKKVSATIGEVWATYLQKWSASGAALYPSDTAAAQALLNGQVSGYINGAGSISNPPLSQSNNVVGHDLKPGDFGFPKALINNASYNIVACNNHGLAKALDQEMTKLHEDGAWASYFKSNKLSKSMIAGTTPPPEGC